MGRFFSRRFCVHLFHRGGLIERRRESFGVIESPGLVV